MQGMYPKHMYTALLFVALNLAIFVMIQSAQKVGVGDEAHGVEHCNQQPDKIQPWHSGSQAA